MLASVGECFKRLLGEVCTVDNYDFTDSVVFFKCTPKAQLRIHGKMILMQISHVRSSVVTKEPDNEAYWSLE
jgi:hypothetical protein